jgi:anti-anti-sigma factor
VSTANEMLALRVALEPPGIAVVAAMGEIDLSNYGDLDRTLDKIEDVERVTVDLTHCTFIDSSALSVLIRHATRFRASGAQFSVIANQGGRRIIEMTNLQDHLGLTAQDSLPRPLPPRLILSDPVD